MSPSLSQWRSYGARPSLLSTGPDPGWLPVICQLTEKIQNFENIPMTDVITYQTDSNSNSALCRYWSYCKVPTFGISELFAQRWLMHGQNSNDIIKSQTFLEIGLIFQVKLKVRSYKKHLYYELVSMTSQYLRIVISPRASQMCFTQIKFFFSMDSISRVTTLRRTQHSPGSITQSLETRSRDHLQDPGFG